MKHLHKQTVQTQKNIFLLLLFMGILGMGQKNVERRGKGHRSYLSHEKNPTL